MRNWRLSKAGPHGTAVVEFLSSKKANGTWHMVKVVGRGIPNV